MVKLSGEYGETVQQALLDLHEGIDVDKNLITAAHNFQLKLSFVDNIIMHIDEEYSHHLDFFEFYLRASQVIFDLREELEAFGKHDIHLVLEEEAAEKKGARWVFRHKERLRDVRGEEIADARNIFTKIHAAMQEISQIFAEAEEWLSKASKFMFGAGTREESNLMVIDEAEGQVEYITGKLKTIFQAYEIIFQRALKELEK